MAEHKPLVLGSGGVFEQLPANGTIPASAVPWLVPPPPGTWWNPVPGTTGVQALTVGAMVCFPVLLPAMTLSAVAVVVSTLGAASLIRAGFVTVGTVSGNTEITGVLEDLGTQSAATVGVKTFASALVHPGGVVWCAVVAQAAACNVRSAAAGYGVPIPFGTKTEMPVQTAGAHVSLVATGVTGAIPATAALASDATAAPKLFFKLA